MGMGRIPDAAMHSTLSSSTRQAVAWLVAISLSTSCALAQVAQPLDSRFLLGVGTHQGLGGPVSSRGYVPSTNIGQIKELGVNAFRDDFPWSDFEQVGGRMGFTSQLGRLDAQIKSGVARPFLILAFGHHLVPNSTPPSTDEARRRFTTYAAAAARSVAAQRPIFELWNEWNLAAKKDAAFSVENYLALAKVVQPAVKQAAPGSPLVVGAIGDDPGWTWTQRMLQSGILQYADGASIHLYNFCMGPAKRTSAEVVERLNAFHRLVSDASGNPTFPIYVTEAGWPTATNKCGVNEQAQADNMAQLILWASTASSWLKGIWLYELKDSGANPSDLEHNFGLYHFDNSPKPSACAVRDAWAFIRSSTSAQEKKLPGGVVSIVASTPAGQRIAIWSGDPSRRYAVRLRTSAADATYGSPCDVATQPASGVWMPVSSTPLLISAKTSSAVEFDVRPER
ncbi:hypothetical protein SAMN05216330_1266 [Bradyrhizobium sp. Ghvi]|nr:hypothetical protein SAMN05216330_1266 [Bradyrhizobium sp. Ghvi]